MVKWDIYVGAIENTIVNDSINKHTVTNFK